MNDSNIEKQLLNFHKKELLLSDDVLLIFLGHSHDAMVEAKAIYSLETQLQRILESLMSVMSDPCQYTRIRIWEWNYDACPAVGGQDKVVNPYLLRANIAVFVFKTYIGPVTWKELNYYRTQMNKRIPVIAIFPEEPPGPEIMMDPQGAARWADLLAKRIELTSDWEEAQSISVTPIDLYKNLDHLKKIVTEKIQSVISKIVGESLENYTESKYSKKGNVSVSNHKFYSLVP